MNLPAPSSKKHNQNTLPLAMAYSSSTSQEVIVVYLFIYTTVMWVCAHAHQYYLSTNKQCRVYAVKCSVARYNSYKKISLSPVSLLRL